MKRRDFLLQGAVIAGGVAVGCTPRVTADGIVTTAASPSPGDLAYRDLAMLALDAARSAGASYADVRINRNRERMVRAREQRVTSLMDDETMGFGLRVLVDGTWGFAASRELTPDEIARVARQAADQARANRAARLRPVELAPAEVHPHGEWRSPIEIDPFDVPIEDQVAVLLAANEAALRVPRARFVNSSMAFVREEKTFASTEGTFTEQTVYRSWPTLTVTAVSADGSDFQTRMSTPVQPMGLGYEHVRDSDFPGNAPIGAEEAVEKLSARPVEPGKYDLVLMPSHLFLTIHESIAHPTELDRIMGYEANFAGTSFISPPEDFLGSFRYGPEWMQIQGERSAPGGLATVGYDDEGVRPRDYLIVKDGILHDLQTTREQAPWLADWYRRIGEPVRSHGNSLAQSWADVQFQRMPNINLLPNTERDVTFEELIGDVEHGIVIEGRGSYSIDQQRYNAQFGGQVYHEIRNGRITGMLKDVAYQMRTPEFWNSMDLTGGPSSYELGGTFRDGKGQPSQAIAVSHGCAPTRFRGADVINTAS
jgi:TldD protein